MPNLRRIKCSLASTTGPATSTTLAYISINTQTLATRVNYVLQAAGYKFSATGGEQGNMTNVAVSNSNFVVNSPQLADISGQFVNIANFPATSGTVSITGTVNTLTDISGQFVNIANFPENIIQGKNTVNNAAMNINATDNRLLVNSLVVGNTGNLLVINADGSINVSGGGTGGGGSSVVQGINTVDGVTAMNINATSNRLLVNSLSIGKTAGGAEYPLVITSAGNLIVEAKCHDGANNAITSTVVSTKRGLDVNIISGGGDSLTPQGTFNNIHSGNLTALTFSTALNINNLFGNESVISYEDTAIALTSFISIHGSFDNVNYFYIGVLQPALIGTTVRQASAVLKLKGLQWIIILNTNATTTATAVKCTLFSG